MEVPRYDSEDITATGEDLVERVPEIGGVARHRIADMSNVFLPALADLVAELLSNGSLTDTPFAAIPVVDYDVGYQGASKSASSRVGIRRSKRWRG